MIKLNSKGFSPVHILLLVLIAGMIGGVGYYVYISQKETKQNLDNSASSQADPQKSDKKEEVKEEKDETKTELNKGYLVINELGVKFKLSSSLEGLYYIIGDEGRTAYFSLEELRATDCAADKTSQVALTRYTEQDFIRDETVAPLKESSKIIGDYYFYAIGGQSACSEDSKTQERATEMRMEIVKLLPESLEAVQ
jgi:hypothetical protein